MKTVADEQMRPAAGAQSGDDDSLRVFRYRSLDQASAHAFFVLERSLEDAPGQSIAVMARNWSDLDRLRARLEAAGVPFVLHHADHHRPVHRRHPAERLLRGLWRTRAQVEGSAVELLGQRLLTMGRDPSEPSVRALLDFAEQIDRARDLGDGHGLASIDTVELADSLLLASRDAAQRGHGAVGGGASVHLSTFHSAKGLEFDKTILLPVRSYRQTDGGGESGRDEERRLFYVALTRARQQVIVCTLGRPGEPCEELAVAARDIGDRVARLPAPRVACLDCDPSDVQLANRTVGQAQAHISGMREGDALVVHRTARGIELRHAGQTVGLLSAAGKLRMSRLLEQNGQSRELRAVVHEIFVHLERRNDGSLRRRSLVIIPAIRAHY